MFRGPAERELVNHDFLLRKRVEDRPREGDRGVPSSARRGWPIAAVSAAAVGGVPTLFGDARCILDEDAY